MESHPCDCCRQKPVVHVLCSSVGAMSNGYCQECAEIGAEPEWSFTYLWDYVAEGDRTKLAEFVRSLVTFKDGRYWTWDEWADWRTYHWFEPDPVCHWWAFEPHGPLTIPEEFAEMFAPSDTSGDDIPDFPLTRSAS